MIDRNRKMKVTLVTVALATIGFFACGLIPTLIPAYGTFLTFLGAVLGLYSGANLLSHKYEFIHTKDRSSNSNNNQ